MSDELLPEVRLLEAAGVDWEAIHVNQFSTEVPELHAHVALVQFTGTAVVRDPEQIKKIREVLPEYEEYRNKKGGEASV